MPLLLVLGQEHKAFPLHHDPNIGDNTQVLNATYTADQHDVPYVSTTESLAYCMIHTQQVQSSRLSALASLIGPKAERYLTRLPSFLIQHELHQ